jgi:pimeloyl-ACP methyl ester carboxylesterase
VLDYLQTDPAVDGTKVAVVGHSRGGKTALWAAAQDERFAMAVSNCSGRGGASLTRRRMGETVKVINKGFPYWFCGNYKKYDDNEDALPVDQHQLIALIAPRAVYVASAETDFWADPRGELLALAQASPVYALYGFAGPGVEERPAVEAPGAWDRQAYHMHAGGHNLTPYDWERYMDFGDKVWGRRH